MPKTGQDFQDGRQFSSVVEQLIRNEQVVGSSPTTGSILTKKFANFLTPLTSPGSILKIFGPYPNVTKSKSRVSKNEK